MNAQAVAVIIAGALTVIGTLAAQYFGHRATTKQLDRTLGEQRTQTLNQRFATAADQLGNDKPAIRLAGVYAMAGLADDWPENRQTCVDVLCAYLRMPYEPDPAEGLDFRANREVRHSVIRIIAARLRDGADPSWQGLNFDFTGVVFDGGDFHSTWFSGGLTTFSHAEFSGHVQFGGAKFSGGTVSFDFANFSDGSVSFVGAEFSASLVSFGYAKFSGSNVTFQKAEFSGGTVSFDAAEFSRGQVEFYGARYSGGTVGFRGAMFSSGYVYFGHGYFSGGTVDFSDARFSGDRVVFEDAEFSGATVDFSKVSDWSRPPKFPWKSTPPPGMMLPE